jgi:hypothetical protein
MGRRRPRREAHSVDMRTVDEIARCQTFRSLGQRASGDRTADYF